MAINLNVLPPGAGSYEVPFYEAQAISVGVPFAACRSISSGGASQDITITLASGNSVIFKAVPVGTILSVAATNVTVAANGNLVALY